MPFEMQGFDTDNGSEFFNTVLEYYLLSRKRKINWTRSRPYKKNDQAQSPCERILNCEKVSDAAKKKLRDTRAKLDPMELSDLVEKKLEVIFDQLAKIDEIKAEEEQWEAEIFGEHPPRAAVAGSVPAPLANAPCASTPPAPAEKPLVKTPQKKHKPNQVWAS